MNCRNCGNQVGQGAEICTSCGMRPLAGNKFCQNCGSDVVAQQEICIKCGVRLLGGQIGGSTGSGGHGRLVYPSSPPKSPTTATLMTCLLTGLGQMYLGQVAKGVVILISAIILGFLTVGVAAVPIWVVTMIDANMIAKKLERGTPVGEWEFF